MGELIGAVKRWKRCPKASLLTTDTLLKQNVKGWLGHSLQYGQGAEMSAHWSSLFCIIDYFTDFPYIFDLLGKSVRYVTTICGYIIYWFSLHIFLRNVGNVSKIVWNVCSVLILLTLPTFLPHHPFRVTRNVGKISKLCNHI